jgi:adenylate kinase family enzyme
MNIMDVSTKMKPTLFATLGLPGSGKSTWAKKMCAFENTDDKLSGSVMIRAIETTKDDIREELHRGVWSKENEKIVVQTQTNRIKTALTFGVNVYVHDTNFAQYDRLNAIAKECDADIVWVDFTQVPIEECIRRDSLRDGKKRVGEAVIRKIAAQAKII